MIEIIINTENEAFSGQKVGHEVARILRELADKSERGEAEDSEIRLHDINGNYVGQMTYEPEYFSPSREN